MDSENAGDHFHHPDDAKYMRNIRRGAPDAFAKLLEFDEAALRAPTKEIPRKYTELMALSVALTTQRVYCIEAHTKAAKQEGATEGEIAEAVFITAGLRAEGGLSHGMMAMEFHQQDES